MYHKLSTQTYKVLFATQLVASKPSQEEWGESILLNLCNNSNIEIIFVMAPVCSLITPPITNRRLSIYISIHEVNIQKSVVPILRMRDSKLLHLPINILKHYPWISIIDDVQI